MHRLAIFILATTVCMAADTSLERLTPVSPVFDSQSVTHSAKPVPEVQKTVNITTEEIRFSADRFQLAGVLVRPEGEGPHPAIIFIHGDGPVNRDGYGVYRPIWKRFVEMGYACLSWDKPGVGRSTGAFTPHATYEERAGIVREAIRFLKARTDIDATSIGLWSISQAGYVAPMVCAGSPDIAFLIAVSTPTVNPVEQTAHLIEQEIRRSGLGDAAARTYAWYYRQREQAESYREYLRYARTLNRHTIVRERLGLGDIVSEADFVPASANRDNLVEPLEWLEQVSVPVLAVFGGRDTQLEVKEAIRHYRIAMRKAGNGRFRVVKLDQADHMIFESLTGSIQEMRDHLVSGVYRLAPGYLRGMENFLTTVNRMRRN